MRRVAVLSTIYPNPERPNYGVFVEHRVRRVAQSRAVDLRVIAPVPWFFASNSLFGRYASLARVPATERRHEIEIVRPRFLSIPKIGMTLGPLLMAICLYPVFRRLKSQFDFQLIDAHYAYPEGVAAAILARRFAVPYIVTGRGTDLHLIPKFRGPRAWLRWALPGAAAVVGVSEAIRREAIALGVSPERAITIRNGVDLGLFAPRPREEVRRALDVSGTLLLSVGHLIERKGNHITIAALRDLTECYLAIVGTGEERAQLERQARQLGVAARVRFVGEVPQSELAEWYSAADLLVLPSSREGIANVALEAMACGTRVVATDVGGHSEVITSAIAGKLLAARTPEALTAAVRELLAQPVDRGATRRHAEAFSWERTTAAVVSLLERTVPAQTKELAA